MKTEKLIFVGLLVVMVIALKVYFTFLDHDGIRLFIAPTSWLVSIITNAPGKFLPGLGYLHADLNILIDKSCSGFTFWQLTLVTLGFHFQSRIRRGGDILWYLLTIIIVGYLLTVMVNTARISLSTFLHRKDFGLSLPDVEWLHQAEGAFTYLIALILIHYTTILILKRRPVYEVAA
jgi:exosortase K